MPRFQRYFRRAQASKNWILKFFWTVLLKLSRDKYLVELSSHTSIGPGLYIGHAYCITINPEAILGKNVSIHRGVLIGQENRGSRRGTPTIGDNVWIGINATVVGAVHIGNDVLIAPNSYVNCDIPDHSIVFGNPCVIKTSDHATRGYI